MRCDVRGKLVRADELPSWGNQQGPWPKTPLTAAVPWGLVRVFFLSRKRVKAAVNLELYLRKIRIIYQLPAGWRGGGCTPRVEDAWAASLGSARGQTPRAMGRRVASGPILH